METLDLIRTVLADVTKQNVPVLTGDMDIVDDLDLGSILFVPFLLALEDHVNDVQTMAAQ